jgi:hypothetical protein
MNKPRRCHSFLLIFALLPSDTEESGAAPAFPLKVSTDGHYLTDATGQPSFYHADTSWALPRNTKVAEADEYFAQRAKAGFTAIHMHAATKEVGPVKNVNGDEPFAPLAMPAVTSGSASSTGR